MKQDRIGGSRKGQGKARRNRWYEEGVFAETVPLVCVLLGVCDSTGLPWK